MPATATNSSTTRTNGARAVRPAATRKCFLSHCAHGPLSRAAVEENSPDNFLLFSIDTYHSTWFNVITEANNENEVNVMVQCPACCDDERQEHLGTLGALDWWRCRYCGITYNTEVSGEEVD